MVDQTTPHIQITTPITLVSNETLFELYEKGNLQPAASQRILSRPEVCRTLSTPQDLAAIRLRASTMGATVNTLHRSGAMTPPATPTEREEEPTMWSSCFPSLKGTPPSKPILRVDTSLAITASRVPKSDREGSITHSEKGSTDIKLFPYWVSDYSCGEKQNRKLLGSGLWSDVYLAIPTPSLSTSPLTPSTSDSLELSTPSTTHLHNRGPPFSSVNPSRHPPQPSAYAIKMTASKSAKRVLTEEARTLTFLSQAPGCEKHVVGFYGQDPRNDAIVMQAMDMTLDHFITTHLNPLSEQARAAELKRVFPGLAQGLLNGLIWLHEHGCTHADIKPANILLSTSTTAGSPATPQAVFTDFSSATLSHHDFESPRENPISSPPCTPPQRRPPTPLGGGTWDYLDPALLAAHNTASAPSPRSDLWALALTLVVLVLGCSPFDGLGGNAFRKRECIKQGVPLTYIGYGDDGMRNVKRMERLGVGLGWDVRRWFGRVLRRDEGERVGSGEWRRGWGV